MADQAGPAAATRPVQALPPRQLAVPWIAVAALAAAAWAVTQPVRQATATNVSYNGHWSANFSGTNSFVTDFRYEG